MLWNNSKIASKVNNATTLKLEILIAITEKAH